MRILLASITFAVTIGGLFLFENYKTRPPQEDYAQILQALKNQNQTPLPTKAQSTNPIAKTALKALSTPSASITASRVITTISPSPGLSASPVTTAVPTSSPASTSASSRDSAPRGSPQATISGSPQPSPEASTGTASPSPSTTPTPSPSTSTSSRDSVPRGSGPTATPQPSQQDDQIMIVSLTSPAQQNTTAKLDIKSMSEAQCTIKVVLPSGSQSTAKGIEPKTADTAGNISWSWKISWNTKPGIATIDLNCSKDGQNSAKTIQMEITE